MTAFKYRIWKKCLERVSQIDARDVDTCLQKKKPWGMNPISGASVTTETSSVMGGRVILVGKSQREKTIWWHRL